MINFKNKIIYRSYDILRKFKRIVYTYIVHIIVDILILHQTYN